MRALLLHLLWWGSWVSASAAAGATVADAMDLEGMTDEELERICAERGFELRMEEVDSHEDYVEAARECLLIEQQMEELISENPELLKELEAERDRLKAEEDRLMKEKARLESERKEAKQQSQQSSFFGSRGSGGSATKASATARTLKESPKSNDLEERIEEVTKENEQKVAVQDERVSDLTTTLDRIFLGVLPRPIQQFIRRVLVRLKVDVTELLTFMRRQVDAILGIAFKQITSEEKVQQQQQRQRAAECEPGVASEELEL